MDFKSLQILFKRESQDQNPDLDFKKKRENRSKIENEFVPGYTRKESTHTQYIEPS